MAEGGNSVKLNVYDLSQGLARQLSTSFLGKPIEAIWHTGVVVFGREYYFGAGIQQDPAGETPYGTPVRTVDLGLTHVPKDVFEDYLREISPRYTADTYNLLTNNCNNFSNEIAQFLVGANIPSYILDLPKEVMSSPMGALIMPMIQRLETTMRSGSVPKAPEFVPANPLVAAQGSLNSAKASSTGASRVETTEAKSEMLDPLGEARTRVQEEITKEFAAIMATGTVRASEAAALATRRVIEKHSRVQG